MIGGARLNATLEKYVCNVHVLVQVCTPCPLGLSYDGLRSLYFFFFFFFFW